MSVTSLSVPPAAAALSVLCRCLIPCASRRATVLCQRSNGEWTHAKVHSFEPCRLRGHAHVAGGQVPPQSAGLERRRHLERVRVPKDMLTTSGASDTILSSKTDDDDDDDDGSNDGISWARITLERLKEIEDDESDWLLEDILLFVSWWAWWPRLDEKNSRSVALPLLHDRCPHSSVGTHVLLWLSPYLLRRQDEKTAVGFPVSYSFFPVVVVVLLLLLLRVVVVVVVVVVVCLVSLIGRWFRIGFISRLTPSPSLAPLPSYPFLPPLLLLLLLIDSSRKVMSNGTPIHCHISVLCILVFLCWTIRCRRGIIKGPLMLEMGVLPGCGRERRDNDPLHYRHCGVDVLLFGYRSTVRLYRLRTPA